MKNCKSLKVQLICLISMVLWCFNTSAAQHDLTDTENTAQAAETLLQQLNEAYAGMGYFVADFTQIKAVKFLSKPLESKGRIEFVKNQGLVWEIKHPVWVKTTITDEGIFKTNAYQANQPVKDVQMQAVADLMAELFNAQLNQLSSRFDISASASDEHIETDETIKTWTVVLVPQSKLIKKALASLEISGNLTENGTSTGINSLVMYAPSGDKTTINFDAVTIEDQVPVGVNLNDF